MSKLCAFLCLACASGLAQEKAPAFDVASVKPAAPAVPGMRDTCGVGDWGSSDPTRFTARWRTLKQLILCAYDIEEFRISGGGDTVEKGRYDIDARPDGPVSHQQMMTMLQTLLADRFQLTLHRETKPVEVTVLSFSKGGPKFGPKFHAIKDDEPPVAKVEGQRQYGPIAIKTWALGLRLNMQYSVAPAEAPANIPPILDRTGLDGVYQIILEGIEQRESFFEWASILDRQLGLKLEIRKVPLESIVIDNASKPTDN